LRLRGYRSVEITPSDDAPRYLANELGDPVYVGIGDGDLDAALGEIDLTPKPGAEEPYIPPVPDEE
jgi:hypothetical protein